jgi:hypothetical protein
MIRTTLAQAYIKRSIRPLYSWTQATPKSAFLDPAWDRSIAIYPGMVGMRNGPDQVTLADGTGYPYGLFANFIGGYSIDELLDQGVNALGIWVLGPDAEFEIDSPAFDNSVTWTDPTDGTEVMVHYWATGVGRGKLVPAGASKGSHTISTLPVARLLKVNSTTTITIGGNVSRLPKLS